MYIVRFETDGAEAPLFVGPFVSLDNAERFARKHNGTTILLDPVEDYAV